MEAIKTTNEALKIIVFKLQANQKFKKETNLASFICGRSLVSEFSKNEDYNIGYDLHLDGSIKKVALVDVVTGSIVGLNYLTCKKGFYTIKQKQD